MLMSDILQEVKKKMWKEKATISRYTVGHPCLSISFNQHDEPHYVGLPAFLNDVMQPQYKRKVLFINSNVN